MPTCPAAAASRRRAPASSWPAVSRGMLPSLCCSLTTTSSAEVTPGALPVPSSELQLLRGWGATKTTKTVSLIISTVQPWNSGMWDPRGIRGPAFRAGVITASRGLGLSPAPLSLLNTVACSLCQLGEPPAYPLNLSPVSRNPFPTLSRLHGNGLVSHL